MFGALHFLQFVLHQTARIDHSGARRQCHHRTFVCVCGLIRFRFPFLTLCCLDIFQMFVEVLRSTSATSDLKPELLALKPPKVEVTSDGVLESTEARLAHETERERLVLMALTNAASRSVHHPVLFQAGLFLVLVQYMKKALTRPSNQLYVATCSHL